MTAFDAALAGTALPGLPAASFAGRSASATKLPLWARWAAAALGLLLVATVGKFLMDGRSAGDDSVIRLSIDPPPGTSFDVVNWAAPAVTPDGRAVVFATRGENGVRLYLRRLDDYEARPLGSALEVIPVVTMSPDGQWVAATSIGTEMLKVGTAGASTPSVLGAMRDWYTWGGPQWLSDTALVRQHPIFIDVTPLAGSAREFARIDSVRGERRFLASVTLPDGQVVASILTGSGIRSAFITGSERVWIGGLDGARVRAFLPPATMIVEREGRFIAGRLRRGSTQFADPRELALSAPPTATIAFGGDGTIAYFRHERGAGRRLVWVNRHGEATPIAVTPGEYRQPRLSPDGSRAAVYGATADRLFAVEVIDLRTGARTLLSSEEYSAAPTWSADGRTVAYAVGFELPQRVVRRNADGSGAERLAFTVPFRGSPMWEAKDGTIVLEVLGETEDVISVDASGKAGPAITSPRSQRLPVLSPDGRWIAYMSNETGRFEVLVQPWPALDQKWSISTEGGTEPVWSRDGRELYFRRGQDMMVSRIRTTPDFQASRPEVLFDARRYAADPYGDPSYDVARDGRFLMIEDDPHARVELRVEVRALKDWIRD